MSIKPIDIKTDLLANNDASRMRENQKNHEAGQAALVTQNKEADKQKAETVQKTDATEGKKVKEEEEKKKKQAAKSKQAKKKHKDNENEEEEKKKKHPQILDGIRGLQIDIKI